MYITIVKQSASSGSKNEKGCSGLVHWDDPEGRGRGVQDGEHMDTHA